MKTVLVLLIILLCRNLSFSQSIDHQVISAMGNYKDAGSVYASSTTGEVITVTFIQSTLVITQGFQQGLPTDFPVGIEENKPEGINISVYPNPTMEKLTLEFSLTNSMKVVISTYNNVGQVLFKSNELNIQNHSKQELDFSKLPAGNYFIHIKSSDGKLNQGYKVQKKSI